MLKEFRDFIARGNVLELAVAVIIGAAFGKIIDSLVADIINPIIGLIFGQPDFSSVYINLSGQVFPTYAAAKEAGAHVIGVGAFITAVINFLIIAFALFLIVRSANRMKKEQAAAPAGPTKEEVLLTEIRDAIRLQR
ncbi:MAG: large conductance mechanosensitive channel protein MscL [Chloroflexi bacterium SZAS-1]|jgi:large conductance mechanosensitive channel|nr:large conductance mechanosensitive channel protein MscL [Chloroflexi bacterium SZAS-1]